MLLSAIVLPEVGKLCLRVQIRYPELGGLLPEASYNTSGFADELFNVQIVDASLNIIYKCKEVTKKV